MSLLDRVDLAAAHQQGLASTAQLGAEGVARGSISHAVARGRLVRVAPRVYSRAPLPPWPRHLVGPEGADPDFVLRVRAGLLSRPGTAASGRTAACLHGWGLLREPVGEVELVVPHGRSRGDGGPTRSRSPAVTELRPLPGQAPLLVATPVATAVSLAAVLPVREAVVAVDSALRSGAVELAELAAVRRCGRSGQGLVAGVLARCDPLAGSVLESLARLDLVSAGLGGFVTQHELRDRAGLMRVDFCWLAARLVLEVDGARWHTDPARDQLRDNRLAALGFRVVRLTWSQVTGDPRWWAVVASALAEPLVAAPPVGTRRRRRTLTPTTAAP